MIVADLELDLDVFQGPFDLLLALILREEVELAEVPIAEIIAAYVERAYERGELDLESASEFLVLVAALLEIKVRLLFPSDEEIEELTPEQAEAELFARLIEYRRFQGAAGWLRDRAAQTPRIFRLGPAPLAPPRPAPLVLEFSEDPWRLAEAVDTLLVPPPPIDVSSVRRPLVSVDVFLERFRVDPPRSPRLRVRRGRARARPAVPGRGVPGRARARQARRGRGRAGRDVRPDPGGRRRAAPSGRSRERADPLRRGAAVHQHRAAVAGRAGDADRVAARAHRAGARCAARPLLRGAVGRRAGEGGRRLRVPRVARHRGRLRTA